MIRETFERNLKFSLPWLAVLPVVYYLPIRSESADDNRGIAHWIDLMGKEGLSEMDTEEMVEGYYEEIMDQASKGSLKRSLLNPDKTDKPRDWDRIGTFEGTEKGIPYLRYKFKVNQQGLVYKDAPFSTNQWGMRDREYTLDKPAGTRRIALCGASIAMGSGITMEQTYENLLEEKLNADHPGDAGVDHFEILNFSVPGYRFAQVFDVILDEAPKFQPDVFILPITRLGVGDKWSRHLVYLLSEGGDLKYDFLKDVCEKAGTLPKGKASKNAHLLAPYREDVTHEMVRRIKEKVDELGAGLIVMLVPHPGDKPDIKPRLRELSDVFAEYGVPVIDVIDAYDAHENLEDLYVAPWDHHPNAEGHRLLFDAMYKKLMDDPQARAMLLGESSGE